MRELRELGELGDLRIYIYIFLFLELLWDLRNCEKKKTKKVTSSCSHATITDGSADFSVGFANKEAAPAETSRFDTSRERSWEISVNSVEA